jgi:hypothetical protein
MIRSRGQGRRQIVRSLTFFTQAEGGNAGKIEGVGLLRVDREGLTIECHRRCEITGLMPGEALSEKESSLLPCPARACRFFALAHSILNHPRLGGRLF